MEDGFEIVRHQKLIVHDMKLAESLEKLDVDKTQFTFNGKMFTGKTAYDDYFNELNEVNNFNRKRHDESRKAQETAEAKA